MQVGGCVCVGVGGGETGRCGGGCDDGGWVNRMLSV